MQEGGPPQRPRVGERYRPLGRVENDLDPAIADDVDDVRPSFGDLVDAFGLDPVLDEIPLGPAGSDDPEAQRGKKLHRGQNARLVRVTNGNEHGSLPGQSGAAADLTLGEGDRER